MQFAVWPGTQQPWPDILEVARHAELTGWDRVYVADHFMSNDDDADGPMLECWAVVTALAAAVPRVGIGTLVCGNTYRHPAVLANQAATADVVSGGRIILGLGAGWQENEHASVRHRAARPCRERLDRFAEACAIVRSLATQERTTFHGEHYRLTDAPDGAQARRPAPAARRRRRREADAAHRRRARPGVERLEHARGVRAQVRRPRPPLRRPRPRPRRDPPLHPGPAVPVRRPGVPRPHPRHRHRPCRPSSARRPRSSTIVGAYRDAGVDELIVPDFTIGTGARRTDTLDLFKEQVAVHF